MIGDHKVCTCEKRQTEFTLVTMGKKVPVWFESPIEMDHHVVASYAQLAIDCTLNDVKK